MELLDDGGLTIWTARRALSFVEQTPLVINGVEVSCTPVAVNKISCRCIAQVPQEHMARVLAGARRDDRVADTVTPAPAPDGPLELTAVRFHRRTGTPFTHVVSPLPPAFHRRGGAPIVLREPNEIRWFGDPAVAARGLRINGHAVAHIEPWKQGWHGYTAPVEDIIVAGRAAMPPAPSPSPTPETGTSITAGLRVYSATSVVRAIEAALGRDVRLFGRSVSDEAIACLTRGGLDQFLREDATDRVNYIADQGGRNFDCENFSETVRSNLARRHGVNSCAVVWGDGHAWCAAAVVGADGPDIVLFEPQTDAVVPITDLTGQYSVARRAEVLL